MKKRGLRGPTRIYDAISVTPIKLCLSIMPLKSWLIQKKTSLCSLHLIPKKRRESRVRDILILALSSNFQVRGKKRSIPLNPHKILHQNAFHITLDLCRIANFPHTFFLLHDGQLLSIIEKQSVCIDINSRTSCCKQMRK